MLPTACFLKITHLVPQLVKKFLLFYETRMFITACIKAHNFFSHQSSLLPTDFFKIDFNIILPSTPRSSEWSLSFMFPYRNSVWISPITHTCHRPHPSLSSSLDHLNNLWCGAQINFCTFLLLPTSEVRISSSATFYRTQSAQVLPLTFRRLMSTIVDVPHR